MINFKKYAQKLQLAVFSALHMVTSALSGHRVKKIAKPCLHCGTPTTHNKILCSVECHALAKVMHMVDGNDIVVPNKGKLSRAKRKSVRATQAKITNYHNDRGYA